MLIGLAWQQGANMLLCFVRDISINPAGTGTGLTMSTRSRHGQRTRFHANPGPPGSMLSRVAWIHMGSPGGPLLAHGSMHVLGVHGGTWAHGHMAYYLVAGASMATRAHALINIAWKRLYGSCGSMTAWSDMGPAPAVVCRCERAQPRARTAWGHRRHEIASNQIRSDRTNFNSQGRHSGQGEHTILLIGTGHHVRDARELCADGDGNDNHSSNLHGASFNDYRPIADKHH